MIYSHGTLGIIGLGSVGARLAAAAACAGIQVTAVVRDQAAAQRAERTLGAALERESGLGRISPHAAEAALARVRITTDFTALADAHIVVEAVPERLADKVAVLRAAHEVCPPETVFATTATSVSVTETAARSGRPSQVAGLHPVPAESLTGVAELVPTATTAPTVLARLQALAQRLGWTTVRVGDRPGLVSSRLLLGYLNRAARMYEDGYAGRDDIDSAMRLGGGLPMGPLEQIDLMGVDTVCDALAELADRTGDPSVEPAPVLRRMADAGQLGRKSGQGFYSYRDAVLNPAEPEPATGASGVRRVAVIGSGTMAAGIAEVCAKAGFATVLLARSAEKAERTRRAVAASLMKATSRGKLGLGVGQATLNRLTAGSGLEQAADADVVVEAVTEDLSVKQELFRELARICRPGTVLASSTSSLRIADLALASGRPGEVIGLHFFNPAPVTRLVEVVNTPETAQRTTDTARAFVAELGKHVVECKDRPGFIVNALLFPYLNEAVEMLGTHYADIEEIDTVFHEGCGFPLGPFQLLDAVGLDVALQIQQALHTDAPDFHAPPAPLLTYLVAAGHQGRKTGVGFRTHAAPPQAA